MIDTRDERYAHRLQSLSAPRWKRLLNVQAPYQYNLRRQRLGRTLEVGCGTGRNLATLGTGAVGVDHNRTSVRIARQAGHTALTNAEWSTHHLNQAGAFDALLIAHVVEHMDRSQALELMGTFLPAVRSGGKVFFICPQERGYFSDSTHVRWTTGGDLQDLARDAGLVPGKWRSFPFPRLAGRWFTYNEFTLLAIKP